MVKGSLNWMLPQFQKPILGYVKVLRIKEAFVLRNLLPSTALDPTVDFETFDHF